MLLVSYVTFISALETEMNENADRIIELQHTQDKGELKERSARGKLLDKMIKVHSAAKKLSSGVVSVDQDLKKLG